MRSDAGSKNRKAIGNICTNFPVSAVITLKRYKKLQTIESE
jgi:hypothetical protein